MLHNLGSLLRSTARQWSEHKILRLSAALAYYSIFSIAPLLVIVIALTGWLFGPDAVRGQLEQQLRASMGRAAAETVQSMVQSAYKPGQGAWAALIGLITLLAGASGVFGQLKDALNTIWDARPRPGSGVLAFVRDQFVSFGMVLVIGFLMLTSLILTTATAAAWDLISAYLPVSKFLLSAAGFVISATIIATLFALIFKWLPDAPVRWRETWIGAGVTAALFEIGKLLLGIYLGRASAASSYGAAGAVVLILLWVYYTSVILLSGACFTRACHDECPSLSGLQPSKKVTGQTGKDAQNHTSRAPVAK
ncbi:MAG TPA: YihY/virulence factor BrkB family protein [Chthoniobacteraceae bacterium]|nr:YihY/virulence factor BrkB family protein [Chthoniobacteraceae bacterium]